MSKIYKRTFLSETTFAQKIKHDTPDKHQQDIPGQAALADMSKAKDNLSIQVASAYLEVLYQKELIKIAENQLRLAEVQKKRIEQLCLNGKAAESDLAEVNSAVAADELQLTQQRNSYQLALLDLSQLLELPTPEGFDVETPELPEAGKVSLDIPDAIYQQAVATKPRIKSEELKVRSAEESISIAKSAKLPSLYAQGGLNSNYYKVSGFDATSFGRQMKDNFSKYIGISLSVPIFNRYSTRNQIRTAQAQHVTQQLQLDQAKKDLYKEIQQASYNFVFRKKILDFYQGIEL